MNGHPQHEEDFDLYALGVLEGEEKQALEAHIAVCAACAAKSAEARGRVSLLALASKPIAPPAVVKSRLMEQVRAESSPARAREESRTTERAGGLFGRWTWAWAAAAAVLALATGFLWYQNVKEQEKIQQALREATATELKIQNAQKLIAILQAPDSVMISMASSDSSQVTGKVCYNARLGKLACSTHLPAAPSDKSYQLWLVPMAGNPVSAGLIAPNMISTDDMWMTDVKAGMAAKAFAVTLEPAGGMPQPTGPKVLVGLAPQAVTFSNPKGKIQAYSIHATAWGVASGSTPNWPVHARESSENMR
ncbi:MAG TPA: anti-sigma factor [Candidatus Acidoferrum sp.]|nr:anti-sigma factor [Candidatus Acidoferrum sp.]